MKSKKVNATCPNCGTTISCHPTYQYKVVSNLYPETVEVVVHSIEDLRTTREKVLKTIYSHLTP